MTDFSTPPDLSIPQGATPATPDAAPVETAPLRVRPGVRGGMTAWAGPDGEVTVTRNDGMPSARPAPTTGPIKPTFTSPTGGPVMLKDLGSDTLVIDPTTGEVSSNLGALMASNLIRQGPDGQWELAGPDGRFHEPGRTDRKETADEPEADAQETPAAPDRDYLPPQQEQHLVQMERVLGPQLFANIEAHFLNAEDGQQLSENLISQVGARLQTDRDGAIAAIQEGANYYADQAASVIEAAIGPASEEVFEFGRTTPEGRRLLQEASRRQVNDRDSSGYVALTKAWLIHQSRLDPHRVASGITAGGTKATVKDGKVILTLPGKGGQVSLDAALRGGVIDLKKL
jgi:hypothetical protein